MLKLGLTMSVAAFAAAAGEPVRDDPRARLEARIADEGLRSAETQLEILRAAEGEAQKYGLRGGSGILRSAVVAGSAWVNIGPNNANFQDNGGVYHKVDSGRARRIIVDPR